MKYDVVVVANGNSKRSKLGYNKVFFKMNNNKTVLENACQVFLDDQDCENIIVVTKEKEKVFKSLKLKIIEGGKERTDSVKNGLTLVNSDYVLIHDGARPFIKKEDIDKIKNELKTYDAVILVSKIVNTIKQVSDGMIVKTIDRNNIYNALTPQAFKTSIIKNAYNSIDLAGITDDALLIEKMGIKVRAIEGDSSNIKLTQKEDFEKI